MTSIWHPPSGRNRKFNWKNILTFIPTWYICTSRLLCNFATYNLTACCCKLRNTLTWEYKGKILLCAQWKLNTALINHKRYIRNQSYEECIYQTLFLGAVILIGLLIVYLIIKNLPPHPPPPKKGFFFWSFNKMFVTYCMHTQTHFKSEARENYSTKS